jgi:hypothetical protein
MVPTHSHLNLLAALHDVKFVPSHNIGAPQCGYCVAFHLLGLQLLTIRSGTEAEIYRIIAPWDRALLPQVGKHVVAWHKTPEGSIQAFGRPTLRDPSKNTAYRTKLWAKRRARAI